MRCLLDESPPLIRQVGLPVSLPKANYNGRKERALKARHRFPFEPSSRLGIVMLLKWGLSLDHFDLICGTSLIKALSGDSQRCADRYFLQKCGNALCCLQVPRGSHTQDDVGHAVENLLCGSDSRRPRSFYCSSEVQIGHHRVLITSEVDARDEKDTLVEIKSSSAPSCKSGPLGPADELSAVSDAICCRERCDRSANSLKTTVWQYDAAKGSDCW